MYVLADSRVCCELVDFVCVDFVDICCCCEGFYHGELL